MRCPTQTTSRFSMKVNKHTSFFGSFSQGGTEVSLRHAIRTVDRQAPLVGFMLLINTAAGVIDVCRNRADAHPVSRHYAISIRAVPEDVARPYFACHASLLFTKEVARRLSNGTPVGHRRPTSTSNNAAAKHGRLSLGIFFKVREHDWP